MKHWPLSALACTLLATALPAASRADDAKPTTPASGAASAKPEDGAAAKKPKKTDPAPTPAAPADAPATPAVPAAPAAPADPNEDPRDRRIRELENIVNQLTKRVDQLENKPANPTPPENATPPENPQPAPTSTDTTPKSTATFIPNISVVGNLKFAGGDTGFTEHRGRAFLDEFEVGIQDAVSPSLRYDAFITAGGPDFGLSIEEAYVTAQRLAPGLTARAGVMHVPFGKFNPLHAHQWLYTDEPAVIRAFLGPDQLIGDGAVAEYLLPVKGLFARAELGRWETASDTEKHLGFNGGQNGAWSGRLYFGKELSRTKELELGFSRYMGRGQNALNVGPNRDLAINGIDLTYLSFPGSYRRWMLQGEFITHDTGGFAGSRTRLGAYLTAAYRWSQFWEAGIRGDYTQYPFPIQGHEQDVSLFLTKFITEQTALRLQLTHGSAPGFSDYNQIMLQLLFGSGPHTHNLQ